MFKFRIILNKLIKEKNERKISIIIGPRQVGKTTILKELYNSIKIENKAVYLDLDIFSNFEKISTYENAINFLKVNGYNFEKEKFYLFLDEFQRYSDLSIILKNLYDNHPNLKIYATGSFSILIKSKIQESLAGRKIITKLYPLNFIEFLYFKNRGDLVTKINNLKDIETENLNVLVPTLYEYLYEFMIFGGYPEVVLQENKYDKIKCLESIFDLFIKIDILDYLKIEKIKSFKTIIENIAVLNGQQIKYSELAKISGVDEKTVKNYLEILNESYLVSIIKPFFSNKLNEIRKTPKVYFIDNGVRNYFVNNFNKLEIRNDSSFLFEGYCLSEMIKSGISPDKIKYWRTKERYEIDFVIENEGLIALEVKFKDYINKKDTKGLLKFYKNYEEHIKNLFLISKNIQKKENGINFISPFLINLIK